MEHAGTEECAAVVGTVADVAVNECFVVDADAEIHAAAEAAAAAAATDVAVDVAESAVDDVADEVVDVVAENVADVDTAADIAAVGALSTAERLVGGKMDS